MARIRSFGSPPSGRSSRISLIACFLARCSFSSSGSNSSDGVGAFPYHLDDSGDYRAVHRLGGKVIEHRRGEDRDSRVCQEASVGVRADAPEYVADNPRGIEEDFILGAVEKDHYDLRPWSGIQRIHRFGEVEIGEDVAVEDRVVFIDEFEQGQQCGGVA